MRIWIVSIEYGGPMYKNPGDALEYDVYGVALSREGGDKLVAEAKAYCKENGETLYDGENWDDWSCDVHVEEQEAVP